VIIEAGDKSEYPNPLERLLGSCAEKHSKEAVVEEGISRFFSLSDCKAAYAYFHYRNLSNESALREQIQVKDLVNVKLVNKKMSEEGMIEAYAGPNSTDIIIFKKEKADSSFSVKVFPKIIKPEEHYLSSIREKGKRHQLQIKEKAVEVYFYQL